MKLLYRAPCRVLKFSKLQDVEKHFQFIYSVMVDFQLINTNQRADNEKLRHQIVQLEMQKF